MALIDRPYYSLSLSVSGRSNRDSILHSCASLPDVTSFQLRWLGSLVVRALDLRLDGRDFYSRPPPLVLDG